MILEPSRAFQHVPEPSRRWQIRTSLCLAPQANHRCRPTNSVGQPATARSSRAPACAPSTRLPCAPAPRAPQLCLRVLRVAPPLRRAPQRPAPVGVPRARCHSAPHPLCVLQLLHTPQAQLAPVGLPRLANCLCASPLPPTPTAGRIAPLAELANPAARLLFFSIDWPVPLILGQFRSLGRFAIPIDLRPHIFGEFVGVSPSVRDTCLNCHPETVSSHPRITNG
ncbi:hypothetical protein MANES_15G099650v8 [Manihot esculenta]|uniref:Uncharacterized protein n=1 Tax=Manihot esculenta TaxID=3983 RepID=A0ACB7GC18_MANES|nr:hypothetical protein MANES_15G099650v8 [Manihot esculenta]